MIPAPPPDDVVRETKRVAQTIKADPHVVERLRAHAAERAKAVEKIKTDTGRTSLPIHLPVVPPPSVGGASAVVILLLVVALALLAGCCSVKEHDINALHEAIQAERECVVVRPGFEDAVKKNRDAVDNHLAQQRRAHQ